MYEAKLSSKNQIVVPREVRKRLALKAGDRLVLAVRGDTVILLRKPKKYAEAIKGMSDSMGEAVYPPDYLDKERKSWR